MVIEIKEEEFKNTACVVFPVMWPSSRIRPSTPFLHTTALFLGDIDLDLGGISKDRLHEILDSVDTNYFIYVDTEPEFKLYGPMQNVPVVPLTMNEKMVEIREEIVRTLANHGIVGTSEWPYSPHVTVDPDTYHMNNHPDWVLLQPAQLWYRGDKETIGSARAAGL